MPKDTLGNRQLNTLALVIVGLAALNWGFVEFVDFDLIVDGLSFSEGSTEYQVTVGAVAAAAALKLYNGYVKFVE